MKPPSLSGLVGTWIALLVLLALTCGSSFIAMGGWNLAVNLAVAVAKALLVRTMNFTSSRRATYSS